MSDSTAAILSLGANLGDRAATLHAALAALQDAADAPLVVSRWYETAPMYIEDQPAFYNLAVAASFSLSPPALMQHLLALEQRLGRVRTVRFGPRAIDLDLIAAGPWVHREPTLCVPHPRMLERPFVLIPAAEVAPAWRHPLVGASLQTLARRLDDDARATIRPLAIADAAARYA